jgi:AraC-like DNA-binding protein
MNPYKLDLFAIFIFLGIVQGIFLSVFFFSKGNRKSLANIFYGIFLISLTACITEIFLMYSGYIIHCLYLVDCSEPISFLIGPALYLLVLTKSQGSVSKYQYLHFAFSFIYLLFLIPFLVADDAFKFNSWIQSYKLDLPYRTCEDDPRFFWITEHHTELTLFSLVLYSALSLFEVLRVFREKIESFFTTSNPLLESLRSIVMHPVIATVLVIVIKIFNPNDTGDHVFAAYIAVTIYLISFRVMRQSGFFTQPTLQDTLKYKSSAVTAEQQKNILDKLAEIMKREKPFLRPDFSLPDLAQKLNVSVHTLSQVINAGMGKSFHEMTAQYRVEEAKQLLKEQMNIKVEEIAEQVGYNSKSSFNTAFKKITGKTPSEYRATE